MAVSQSAPQSALINQLIPLDFEEHAVRAILDEHGAPWFHAGDVCRVLGFGNPHQAIASHVDGEDLQKLEVIDSLGRTQQANHVSEFGLYALIVGSTKPEAKRFKRWVTHEVLPAIRKTGGYGIDSTTLDALSGLGEQLQKAAEAMDRPMSVPPTPSRAELKARYSPGGSMSYHQAVQPIHLQYGTAWTTSLAFCHACDLNHAVLGDIVWKMGMKDVLAAADYHPLMISPPAKTIGSIRGYQLSEKGVRQLVDQLDAMEIEKDARHTYHTGAQRILDAFAMTRRPTGSQRRSTGNAALSDTLREMSQAINKLAGIGGRNHG
jgi:prophage antirepressor-like protein